MADANKDITLTIDGRETTVPKGTTVLQAAQAIGINIPTFCWHPKLKSVGACRMCYVEIEKMPKLQVSCATEATPGMTVYTQTPKVKEARRAVLEFLLLNHPLDCPTCDKGGECDLQDNTFAHGIDSSRFDFEKMRFVRDPESTFDDHRLGPEIMRNQNRCILCYKCVRANEEIFGEHDLGAFQRGNVTEIDAAPGRQVDSIYSGNLTEICPVGALTNTDWRYKIRVWKTEPVNSVCPFCADGCNLNLWKARERIYRATSRRNDDIDEGWLCDIGRYGYQIVNHEHRLLTPLIKKQEKQVPANWDEAIGLVARKLKEIRDKKGGVCIGGLISPSLDSRSLYSFSKFFRTVLHSNNVDFRTDYKMLPENYGDLYTKLTSQNFSIGDIEKSDLIIVIGSDLAREHPIVNLRVRKAVTQRLADLYLLNPYRTRAGEIATDEMVHTPGTIEALTNGISLGLAAGSDGSASIEISGFKQMLSPGSVQEISKLSRISADRMNALAAAIRRAKNITLVVGELATNSPAREILTAAICNLVVLGGISQKGQVGFLSKYANSKGAEKLGVMPHLSEKLKRKLEDLWHYYPEFSGMAADKMIQAAKKEEIDALFIMGADPLTLYPDGSFIKEGLGKLDFLVVADLFESKTSELADVVLPISSWAEYNGTFVSLEGRVQSFERAVKPVGSSWPAYEVMNRIAGALRAPLFDSVEEMDEEMAAIIEADDSDSVPAEIREVKTAPENSSKEFTVPLFVVDAPHHFGHLTEKSPSLAAFCGESYAEISPSMAERLGVRDGSPIRIESEIGKLVLPVKVSVTIDSDVVLISRNFTSSPVNGLQMRKRKVERARLTRVED